MTRGRPNPLHHGFVGRLRRARKERGLARAQLSRAAGLALDTVRAIEATVRVPRVDTVCRLAEVLGVSPAWLAFGVEPKEATSQESEPPFRERLILARQARGLTQQQLGALADLTRATINALERQDNVPDIARAERMAKALGVPAAWLAFGIGEGIA